MNQLIEIKNDEMNELLDGTPEDAFTTTEKQEDPLNTVRKLLENGEDAAAVEMVKDKEDMADRLVEEYNAAGIEHRRAGRYEEALHAFRMALVLSPRDEGLYYNLASGYIDRGEWKTAAETINEGLKINHDFTEGIRLLKYIRETGKID
jgi:tetratricopeptide (TPR) repeat protein